MDVQSITDLITALRSETEKNSISPENVGSILQTITDTLSAGVDAEADTRKYADTLVNTRIDKYSEDLAAEVTNRTNADASLQTAIDNEAEIRASGIESLESDLGAEIENRKKAVDAITHRVYDYNKIMALTSESSVDDIKAAFTPRGASAIRYPEAGDLLHRGGERDGMQIALHDDDIVIEKYISDGSLSIGGGVNNFGIEFTDFDGVKVVVSVENNVVSIDRTDMAKKRLFIDLWDKACRDNGKYNADTGYFELNGLTDITYEQALDIYTHTQNPYDSSYTARTNLLNTSTRWVTDYYQKDCTNAFAGFRDAEVIRVDNESYGFTASKVASMLAANRNCKKVIGEINLLYVQNKNDLLYFLNQNDKLETINIKYLRVDLTCPAVVNISAESVAYMINNALTDNNITLTLGDGDTYDRLIADADVQAALDGHPNVTLTYNQ